MMWSQGITTKLHPWDESIRVPFLMRYPRGLGRRGRRIATPLNQPDIMPTLLRLAGLQVPAGVQGSDFSGLARGGREGGNRPALLSLPVPITEARRWGFAEYRGLRSERYTYVRSIHGPWLLYDNHTDPYQMRNLINRPEQKTLQASLDAALNSRLAEVGDRFLPAEHYVQAAKLGHYKEVNAPVGHVRSPWGDWESTLEPSRT
jgi:arylsulfatase A-like enzyme